ncbi:MAG TPA: peptidylprolyl isomerase [Gaiellaceae bacterium]|jgi:parvulin-like peptidyl-prolyl isomerase|nr:peptidylprolyl isomerase [Gaiellaceae bacterium]
MKISRLAPVFVALLAAVALAGCGGGGSSAKLGANDVAAVGGTQISKKQYTDLMATAKRSYKSQGRSFPKQGTQEYATIKSQAMTLLVQQAEREEKAQDLGIDVTDKQVNDRLAQIKKQYFGDSDKKYKAQLASQGLSDEQVRGDVRAQLISEALFAEVTKDVKVSDADVHSYYKQHPQLYKQPESREVRHVLVKKKAQADDLYQQLKSGKDATWCKLAKQFSQDTGSKAQCGKLTVSKGQTVPEFDKTSFALDTKEVSKPVKTTYGWHIIEALGPVKPAKTTPEKQVADSIRQQLLQTKKQQAMAKWVSDTEKDFCGGSSVAYQTGYAPSPDPCTTTSTAATTAQ